jgi:hypothetical protein
MFLTFDMLFTRPRRAAAQNRLERQFQLFVASEDSRRDRLPADEQSGGDALGYSLRLPKPSTTLSPIWKNPNHWAPEGGEGEETPTPRGQSRA